MNWMAAAGLGMAGGAIIEAVNIRDHLTAWQRARHTARLSGQQPLPRLANYVDPPADALAALTHLLLGGLAGLLLHSQISGTVGAIAVGAAAPALFRQLATPGGYLTAAGGDAPAPPGQLTGPAPAPEDGG